MKHKSYKRQNITINQQQQALPKINVKICRFS